MSFPPGARNVRCIPLCSLETGVAWVCFSDAGIDFLTSMFCSGMSKVAFKEKVMSIDEPKAHSI